MKVLKVVTSLRGGAGIAALRSARALEASGVEVRVLYLHPADATRKTGPLAEGRPTRFRQRATTALNRLVSSPDSLLATPFTTTVGQLREARLEASAADIIHFHATTNVISTANVIRAAAKVPVVVTLHDERFYTGACHHAAACDGFRRGCRTCPQVVPLVQPWINRSMEEEFRATSGEPALMVVAPSRWIASRARESRLLAGWAAVTRIPNCVPLDVFNPGRRLAARSKLRIDDQKFVIVTIGDKGTALAQDAMNGVSLAATRVQLTNTIWMHIGEGAPRGRFSTVRVPYTTSELEMADHLAAADLYINTTALDNFPNSNLETAASGVPTIVSQVGGAAEVVESTGGGLVVRRSPSEFASATLRLMSDPGLRGALGIDARQGAEDLYGMVLHADALVSLYSQVLDSLKLSRT